MANGKVRYAPADDTLPSPWKALLGFVDGDEYTYYWNTETKETTYVKPTLSHCVQRKETSYERSVTPHSEKPEEQQRKHPVPTEVEVNHRNGENHNGQATDWDSLEVKSSEPPPSERKTSSANGSQRYKRPQEAGDLPAFKRPKTADFPAIKFSSDIISYRNKHEISVSGPNVPHPYVNFASSALSPVLLEEFKSAGFKAPSPIQAQSWSIARQGRDLVAIAKTGSGKTLGYLVPAFLHIDRHRGPDYPRPRVLVLAPTRELATQIKAETKKFGSSSNFQCTCVYGGADKGPQLRDIERGVDIIIATPGRLNDFLKAGKVSIQDVTYVVLDEADRMLDMGFEPQIRAIFAHLPAERQTLMFTATWPREVRTMANDMLQSPVQVNIGQTDDLAANKAITQHVEIIKRFDKLRRLQQILRQEERNSRILVFCSTKRMCDQLASNLSDLNAAAIHGDKSQDAREQVLSQFKSGRSPILVATDVAARGLDVKDIRVVVNYDFPSKFEDYIHRIGRTGRGGATGTAYTFFDDVQDSKYSRRLITVLKGANQRIPEKLAEVAARAY